MAPLHAAVWLAAIFGLSGCGFLKEAIPTSLNPFADYPPVVDVSHSLPSAYPQGRLPEDSGSISEPYVFDTKDPHALPSEHVPVHPYAPDVRIQDSAYWRSHRFKVNERIMHVFSPAEWNAKETTHREHEGYFSSTFTPEGADIDAPGRKINIRYRETYQSLLKKAEALQRAIVMFCGEEHVRILAPEVSKDSMLLFRMCGNLSGGMTETAGLSEYGEISLIRLIRQDDGIYSISHDWRVPAFDANSDDAVFANIPEHTLQEHASALKRTRICPLGSDCNE